MASRSRRSGGVIFTVVFLNAGFFRRQKRGTSRFVSPGGCPDPEKNVESLLRAPPSNLYHAIMRSPSFGLPSPNQVTPSNLRARSTTNQQHTLPCLEMGGGASAMGCFPTNSELGNQRKIICLQGPCVNSSNLS